MNLLLATLVIVNIVLAYIADATIRSITVNLKFTNQPITAVKFDPVDETLLLYGQMTYNGGLKDVYLTRISPNGTQIWISVFNSACYDESGYPDALLQVDVLIGSPMVINDLNRDIYVQGSIAECVTPIEKSAFILAHATNGTILFTERYLKPNGGSLEPTGLAIVHPYLLIAGVTFGSGFNGQPPIWGNDHYMMKVHMSNGSAVWTTIWGVYGFDFLFDIAIDVSAGIVYSTGRMADNYDGVLITGGLDDDADLFINRHYIDNGSRLIGTIMVGSTGRDMALGMAIDTDRELVYACGYAQGPVKGVSLMSDATDQLIVAVYTNNFTIAWLRLIGGVGTMDFASSIAIHPQTGDVYVSGGVSGALIGAYSQYYNGGDIDVSLAVFNPNGTLLGFVNAGNNHRDAGYASCFDPYGNLYIVGLLSSSPGLYIFDNSSTFNMTPIATTTTTSVTSSRTTSTAGTMSSTTSTINNITSTTSTSPISTTASTSTLSSFVSSISSSTNTRFTTTLTFINSVDALETTATIRDVAIAVVVTSSMALSLLIAFIAFTFVLKRRQALIVKQKNVSKQQAIIRANNMTDEMPIIATDNIVTVHSSTSASEYIKYLPRISSGKSSDPTPSMIQGNTTANTVFQSSKRMLFVPGHLSVEQSATVPTYQIFASVNCEVFCCTPLDAELARRSRNKMLAVKYLKKSNPTTIDAFKQEISIMHFFQGRPNFVQLVGFCMEPLTIITDLYSLGSLHDCMYQRRLITPTLSLIMRFSQQITNALCEMHSNGFSHSDLKPQNIFVDKRNGEYNCYLADFGLSRVLDDSNLAVKAYKVMNMKGLTARYAAQEMLAVFRGYRVMKIEELTPEFFLRADIYSMALLLYELTVGYVAWKFQ